MPICNWRLTHYVNMLYSDEPWKLSFSPAVIFFFTLVLYLFIFSLFFFPFFLNMSNILCKTKLTQLSAYNLRLSAIYCYKMVKHAQIISDKYIQNNTYYIITTLIP